MTGPSEETGRAVHRIKQLCPLQYGLKKALQCHLHLLPKPWSNQAYGWEKGEHQGISHIPVVAPFQNAASSAWPQIRSGYTTPHLSNFGCKGPNTSGFHRLLQSHEHTYTHIHIRKTKIFLKSIKDREIQGASRVFIYPRGLAPKNYKWLCSLLFSPNLGSL